MGRLSRLREADAEAAAHQAEVQSSVTDRIAPPVRDVRLELGTRIEFGQSDGAARSTFLVVESVRMMPNGRAIVAVSRDMERSPKGTPPGSYVLRIESPLVGGR